MMVFQLTEADERNEIQVKPEHFLRTIRHLDALVNAQYVDVIHSGQYNNTRDTRKQTEEQPNHLDVDNSDGTLYPCLSVHITCSSALPFYMHCIHALMIMYWQVMIVTPFAEYVLSYI